MNLTDFISKNYILIICVGIGLPIFLISSYRIEGFNSLIEKAIGIVVQQFCSLIIEAICLIFKIINSLEIYIVLLIDALTGKASSNGKIASLAIGVLSMASFYTTYSGMKFFVDQDMVAFLITLGIQAILLSTSLRINDVLNLDVPKNNKFDLNKWIKCIGIGMVILGFGGCIVAYVLSIVNLSYSTRKFIYHILYIVVIIAVLIVIGLMILTLIQTGIKNRSVGGLLLSIYFAVLSVSSFFSYNSFVLIMYPEEVRNVDDFQSYKIGIVNLAERMNADINDDYYVSLGIEIEVELQELESALDNVSDEMYLSQKERQLYEQREDFEAYIKLMTELKELEENAEIEEKSWREEESELITNSGGVGQYTTAMWRDKKNEHITAMNEINNDITEKENEMKEYKEEIVLNVEEYQEMIQAFDNRKEEFDCSQEIDLIRTILNQEKDELKKEEIEYAIFKIENAKSHLLETNNDKLKNDLGDIITVYWKYKKYKRQFYILENQILETNVERGQYDKSYRLIQSYAYKLLMYLPDTNHIFYGANNEIIKTSDLSRSDYYSAMENMKRNINPDLSVIERNIRTFVNNKLIGSVCALMAILIDMMILFVGIILPREICYPSNEKGKYTEHEIKRIMSNLFNKPIRR